MATPGYPRLQIASKATRGFPESSERPSTECMGERPLDATAGIPQPGFYSQVSMDRIPQAGFQCTDSTAKIPQLRFQRQDSTCGIPKPGIHS